MTRQASSRAQHLLEALFPHVTPWLATTMAPEAERVPVPTTPLADELPALMRHRMMSALAQHLQRHRYLADSALRATVQQGAFAETVHSHAVTRQAAAVVDKLTAQGLAVTVVKGPALARCYRVPSTRSFGDVDLVVGRDDFSTVLQSLRRDGWREDPASRQPWPFFHRWCRESVNLERGDDSYTDLHHRPSPWIWTDGLDGAALARRATRQDVAGVSLPFADLADNALAAALQLITDHQAPGSKLVAWRDLAELATVDAGAVAARANDVGLGGVIRCLVTAMPSWLQPPDVLDALDYEIAHPARLVMLLESAARGSYVRNHMARLPTMNAILYAAGTIVPSRSFLDERYPNAPRRRRRWLREVADRAGSPA